MTCEDLLLVMRPYQIVATERILNKIIESEGKNINVQEKLVELLGHTPKEVFVGAIVGVFLSTILYKLMILI